MRIGATVGVAGLGVHESHVGKLLVATPQLIDPNFYRSVVLMLQDDEEGTVGIVLNRPTEESVVSHLPEWADWTPEPGLVHHGGPVDPEVAIGVALTTTGMSTGVPGLSLVNLAEPPGSHEGPVRIYAGYAGWGSEQLTLELAMGSWYLVQASPDDPFEEPGEQWKRVLRRQPGFLSLVSTFPDDVSQN